MNMARAMNTTKTGKQTQHSFLCLVIDISPCRLRSRGIGEAYQTSFYHHVPIGPLGGSIPPGSITNNGEAIATSRLAAFHNVHPTDKCALGRMVGPLRSADCKGKDYYKAYTPAPFFDPGARHIRLVPQGDRRSLRVNLPNMGHPLTLNCVTGRVAHLRLKGKCHG